MFEVGVSDTAQFDHVGFLSPAPGREILIDRFVPWVTFGEQQSR